MSYSLRRGASASKGLHIIDNGDIIATYTTKNTPMGDFGGTQINDLKLDAEGLWSVSLLWCIELSSDVSV